MQGALSKEWQELGLRAHFAREVLYKLLPSGIFPQYDKIIISDVDVVFLGDVAESFLAFSCEEDIYISGVKGNNPNRIFPLTGWKAMYKALSDREFEAVQYGVGGGYLIANLKKWRKDNLESKLLSYLSHNAHKLALAEQDVLNIVCYPKIGKLSQAHIVGHYFWREFGEEWERNPPNVYSKEELDSARLSPIQLHYVGGAKPWNTPSEPKSDIWYSYVVKTPFCTRFLANLESSLINKYIKTTLSYRIRRKFRENPLFWLDGRIYYRAIKKRILRAKSEDFSDSRHDSRSNSHKG